MEKINWFKNPVWDMTTEVLIVGGGPSGVCAAIAAAREDANVLLIERGGFCGGMATAGLVGPFMTCYDKSGNTMIIRGLFDEIVTRLEARGGAIHPSKVRAGTPYTSWIVAGHDHVTPFDAEKLKKLLDDMLCEAGVHILYHADFLQSIVESNRITGIAVMCAEGIKFIRAQAVIDCTGDGNVAASAGVPFVMGNGNGKMQPATMFFRINNVDSEKVEADIARNKDNFYRKNGVNYRSFHWCVEKAKAAGDWTIDRASIGLYRCVRDDEWAVNTSRILNVDSTDSASLTRGEIEGRRQVEQIMAFLNKYVPGCENARLMCTGATLGIRESRHIVGEYCLTAEDVLEGHVSDDAIVLCSNSVDIHGKFGLQSSEYITVRNGEYYGIPYRCLIPKALNGLLIAGRLSLIHI